MVLIVERYTSCIPKTLNDCDRFIYKPSCTSRVAPINMTFRYIYFTTASYSSNTVGEWKPFRRWPKINLTNLMNHNLDSSPCNRETEKCFSPYFFYLPKEAVGFYLILNSAGIIHGREVTSQYHQSGSLVWK